MYAGTTLRHGSGKIVGVHQKIDRIARRHLNKFVDKSVDFPNIKQILHFEGKNGPDGLKRKSSSVDEPWHFIDPTSPDDVGLIVMVNDHITNLAQALRDKNEARASFEAAWLAHAVVDGLTPPHHYPLGDKIQELWGKSRHERLSVMDKNIIRGINRRDTLSKNWEYWGKGGIFTSHFMFEWGVATIIAPDKFEKSYPSTADIKRMRLIGFEATFMQSVQKVYAMKLYDEYGKSGWNRKLAVKTKKTLMPVIIKTVILAWYQAVLLSAEEK